MTALFTDKNLKSEIKLAVMIPKMNDIKIATPPKSGIGFLWICSLSPGISRKPFFEAKRATTGVKIKALK